MKTLKIWNFIGLVFGFYSLDILVKEGHELVYTKKSNETEPLSYLICK